MVERGRTREEGYFMKLCDVPWDSCLSQRWFSCTNNWNWELIADGWGVADAAEVARVPQDKKGRMLVNFKLDGSGKCASYSGVPFLDHLLEVRPAPFLAPAPLPLCTSFRPVPSASAASSRVPLGEPLPFFWFSGTTACTIPVCSVVLFALTPPHPYHPS